MLSDRKLVLNDTSKSLMMKVNAVEAIDKLFHGGSLAPISRLIHIVEDDG